MPVARIDHAAFPTERPEEMLAFYKALGQPILREEEWRRGASGFFSVQIGESKLNIHGPDLHRDPGFTLRAPAAQPGCADLCFVWEGGIDSARELLVAAGAEIVEGPVRRWGGRPGPAGRAMSLYTRDPDGNLIELLAYDVP